MVLNATAVETIIDSAGTWGLIYLIIGAGIFIGAQVLFYFLDKGFRRK